jgi:hypothetical protein
VFSCQAILVALSLLFLAHTQVDTSVVVGEGAFKTAYNFKNRPNLLVLLLRIYHRYFL